MNETTDINETTVQILGMTFDEVEKIVYEADLPYDLIVHGPQDESAVFVTGEGDVLATVVTLGMAGVVRGESRL
ncbi:hypothetical protein G6L37_06920 [Agrobacterium rubi]|nr:hypothetical protein [Agrobacterium rubi]NTF25097.1 hypothetical protein [Agrobacterium rubi]